MARVTYQGILEDAGGAASGRGRTRYVPLRADAIATRRREADSGLKVRISAEQKRWLREVEDLAGKGVDRDAVVRALIDLGRELPVDWPLVAGGEGLRRAVRESVRVRAEPAEGG